MAAKRHACDIPRRNPQISNLRRNPQPYYLRLGIDGNYRPKVKPLNTVRSSGPVLLCCLFLAGQGVFAQDTPSPSVGSPATITSSPQPSPQPSDTAGEPAPPIAPAHPQPGTVDKRLFGVIPNYRADQLQGVYKPISTREKFLIARGDSFDWPNYFLLVGYALQSQIASNGFKHNGGIESFGEFYARGMADQVIGSYFTEAILPSLLHEDPRFFRLGIGSVWRRAYYAATRVFVTRLDNGGSSFNVSEVVGNMGVVAVTTFYYPNSQSASEAVERYGMALGNDAISNLLTEFWPDIKRRIPLLHRKA